MFPGDIKEEQLMCGIKLCLSIMECGVRKAHFCSKDMMERCLRDGALFM